MSMIRQETIASPATTIEATISIEAATTWAIKIGNQTISGELAQVGSMSDEACQEYFDRIFLRLRNAGLVFLRDQAASIKQQRDAEAAAKRNATRAKNAAARAQEAGAAP